MTEATTQATTKATPPRTILVTGASGYIAKHIVLQLLEAGHHVRGSVRTPAKGDALRATLETALGDPQALDRFSTVPLDLEQDAGWDDALSGADVLMHTASPFPMTQPDDEMEAIRPAVEGTRRALEAAARNGVKRVLLTSSVVAVSVRDRPPGAMRFSEADWSETDGPAVTAYSKSKTLAERAAWELAEARGLDLTTINPSLVLGPPLDGEFGTSVALIERLLKKSDPMLPRFGFSVVDVRDIAAMHVAAMERDASIGRRFIGSSSFFWISDVARVIEAACPGRKLNKTVAPDMVVRMLAMFDQSIRTILPTLGREDQFETRAAQEVLGITFRDGRAAIGETAQRLIALGKV